MSGADRSWSYRLLNMRSGGDGRVVGRRHQRAALLGQRLSVLSLESTPT